MDSSAPKQTLRNLIQRFVDAQTIQSGLTAQRSEHLNATDATQIHILSDEPARSANCCQMMHGLVPNDHGKSCMAQIMATLGSSSSAST